ncbi:MAG: NUDIX domain-containing protein [Pirellulales bacterium]
MTRVSAGLMMYRIVDGELEVLLVHPGGPFYRHKDDGVWTIPKGELTKDEAPLAAAEREFTEETGFVPAPPYLPLSDVRTRGGKLIHAWAFEGNCDPAALVSNTVTIEWPPKSGRREQFPEVDRAAFLGLLVASQKIHPAQRPWLDELAEHLRHEGNHTDP